MDETQFSLQYNDKMASSIDSVFASLHHWWSAVAPKPQVILMQHLDQVTFRTLELGDKTITINLI